MNSGIYIRVGKENLLLEQLQSKDREEWLDSLNDKALKRTINILCDTLFDIQMKFDLLDEEEN